MHFSIIVPVFEHWHLIPTLLRCLDRQTIGQAAFEVLLIDNGSSHIQPPNALPDNVRVLACATPGSYAARNTGAAVAAGHWFCFTDADCRPAADWLEKLDAAAKKAEADHLLLAGAVEVVSDADHANSYEVYDIVKGIPQDWYVSRGYAATANLAVTRTDFAAVGRFDEQRFSGGDAQFCRRARAIGINLIYVPEARVLHPARSSWQELRTKARRIKGGQILQQPPLRRTINIFRSFLPPVIAVWRFWRNTRHPLFYRMTAIVIQMRIWGVEMMETVRLLIGWTRERR